MSALVLSSVLTGCASVNWLPQTAAEVDFNGTAAGTNGWTESRGFIDVPKIDDLTAYEAAKAGLKRAGFEISKQDMGNSVVIGKHGMTWNDWNVVAGVYFNTNSDRTRFKIVVKGSDETRDIWAGRIFDGIRRYLASSPAAS